MHFSNIIRWLPLNFAFDSSAVWVRWLDFGGKTLEDPFFFQTVWHLRSQSPPAPERVTDLDSLMSAVRELPQLQPAGVIFHVSRCGSTLLTNALKTGRSVVALSEARPIGTFQHPRTFVKSPFPRERWNAQRRTLLNAVVTLYGHTCATSNPRVVIKCHAGCMLYMALARSVWPTVPFIILVRNPIEVMVSNIAKPASWARARYITPNSRQLFGLTAAELRTMSAEEYCARGIGRFCEAASQQLDGNCFVIDYDDLDLSAIYRVATLFGIDMPPFYSDPVQRVIATYSKDREASRPFQDDRPRKQREATQAVIEAAKVWALPPYDSLRNARLVAAATRSRVN